MRDIIVGTAGHVDHGKTSLIEAMTGYNGDEMAQEKERGITIDLSFCNMQRQDANIAFIDVPGHDKLVKNMISGAFGFDAALLVVAVDDGVMPQTLEHLEVLSIVGVSRVVVALTKSDLASLDILSQRMDEIQMLMDKYPQIECVDILPVSIRDTDSIERLRTLLYSLPPRDMKDAPFFRYYIDRVFSPRGVGTVVTGTVLSGIASKGDKLNVAELNKPATVRGIQIHGSPREHAHTHQRVAFNLDTSHNVLKKGYLICSKGYFRGFSKIDISYKELGGHTLAHNAEVLFISGAKRVEGRILLYDDSPYARLNLNEKVFLQFGDPFVLLLGGRVVAGGEILSAVADPIRKRQMTALLGALDARDFATVFDILLSNHRHGFGLISSYQRFALSHDEVLDIARSLDNTYLDEKALVLYPASASEDIYTIVHSLYEKNPRALLSAASVALRVKWASEALIHSVIQKMHQEGYLRSEGNIYMRSDQEFANLDIELEERVYRILDEDGFTPEAPYNLYDKLDIDRKLGDSILKKLTARKRVIRLAHNLFVTETNLSRVLSVMREIITAQGYIDIRNFKEHTPMSRKYLIAYLEYLDKSAQIDKKGEKRVWR
jgi:selenocysteine-specific elongation factor